MLYLVQSNRMESLAHLLAEELKSPLDSHALLANEQILVQSPGMSTWLRLAIAEHNQIAAALEFPLPSSFIWQLCHTLLPNVPKENAYTKPAMTWKLMELLPTLLHQDSFAPLAQYLKDDAIIDDTQAKQSLKLYQLCAQIADIFDQYLVYRPDWILAWEANEPLLPPYNDNLSPEQAWQPILWRALVEYNDHQLGQNSYHRANLIQGLIHTLSDPNCSLSGLPNRLFVFGISSIAPQTLTVLYHLAKHIDVVMLNLSPCQHYWGDIVDPQVRARMALQYLDKQQLDVNWEDKLEVGNPLLANNGKMGRELLDLILALPEEDTNFNFECYQDPGVDKLLHGVQHDILELTTRGQVLGPDAELFQNLEGRRVLKANDHSISFKSCHSPLREIETLHDHLLLLLSQEDISPKDIVIMMPDVASYAPYIDAVFAAKQGAHYIPYAIADRGAAQESPLINSFLHLLTINQSRFALTDVLGILEVPAVLRKFELSDDELQMIRQWLDRAGVRWGRDGQSRQAQQLPDFEQNAWSFGIKRLILGYSFSDDAPIYQDNLPLDGIEGQDAQALGKLLNFIEAIDELCLALNSECSLNERITQLQTLVDEFYACDDEELPQLQTIHSAITRLNEEITQAHYQSQPEIKVLHNWFVSQLSESRVGQRYLAGSVNFCTLMPMRSIPFKVVCLLGMNDGVYPRVQHPVGFDLVAQFGPRKGDRSRRLDDRYLFLEALLSAREQLYISYIGHSERDNSERIPSMLVSELIEYCQLCYFPEALFEQLPEGVLEQQELVNVPQDILDIEAVEHEIASQLISQQPLQPFDKRLYQADSTLPQSYSKQWCPITTSQNTASDDACHNRFINQPLVLEAEENAAGDDTRVDSAYEALELSALIRFFRNPAQYFFNRALKLDLSLNIQTDDNDEPFSLNALSRYQLQAELIDNAIKAGQDMPDSLLLHKLKLAGELPLKPFDDLLINQYLHDIRPIIGRAHYLKGEQSHDIEVEISLEEKQRQLIGRIDNISAKGLVNYRPGTANARDLIRVYLRHLCLCAMQQTAQQQDTLKPELKPQSPSFVGKHHSYLLDIGHFHAFAPITAEQATAQLNLWVSAFTQGQAQPLLFLPRTAMAYVEADGDHNAKLVEAQKQWLDEQGHLGEGLEPHYQRLYRFPDDFTEADFGQLALRLLSPLLSLYHKAPLSDLTQFVEEQ
ncbi:exodeoxyribonuclease V subunit gamma [Shewanella sp. Isolate11]|uniref:exodeoxyribonuclease V subunit gamma n=1 Tax=Shewanella sp. Isolate11 TaxID=2908530 RepID=UPI001EFDB3FB|nr:exodeoxyribonuclease V subunit gamma [Shewanella sp. Isolate11]MCG9696532.1 exodeoxyribonuclease V subunit gamma [Shewanella sp. Isolate11]